MSGGAAGLALQREARERSMLVHLLHALNQPLTGLQCSLELATSVPRSNEEQVRTLREGLALTARMRLLVEALRELVHSSEMEEATSKLHLEAEVVDCVDQLRPVATARGVEFRVDSHRVLPIHADHNRVATVLLRTIAAALSLCREASVLRIEATAQADSAILTICWVPGAEPEFSPFSRPELGLVIAQAAWESSGGSWVELREESLRACTLQIPMALGFPGPKKHIGDTK